MKKHTPKQIAELFKARDDTWHQKKLILSRGYDSYNFPVKIKNDRISKLAWKNVAKTYYLNEAYKLVIQGWIQ